MSVSSFTYLYNLIYPLQKLSHFGINAWMVWFSTACSPANNTNKPPDILILANQRTPTVPLRNVESLHPSSHKCIIQISYIFEKKEKNEALPDMHLLFLLYILHRAFEGWSLHCTCKNYCISLCLLKELVLLWEPLVYALQKRMGILHL